MDMLKKQPKRNFTESVDVAVKLGIDPKKSDQNVRGSLTLPNSLGKKITIAVRDNILTGYAAGVDWDGALLLDVDGKVSRFYSGHVSLIH